VGVVKKLLKQEGGGIVYAVHLPPIGPLIKAALMTQPKLTVKKGDEPRRSVGRRTASW